MWGHQAKDHKKQQGKGKGVHKAVADAKYNRGARQEVGIECWIQEAAFVALSTPESVNAIISEA